jgi:hypothetical protein
MLLMDRGLTSPSEGLGTPFRLLDTSPIVLSVVDGGCMILAAAPERLLRVGSQLSRANVDDEVLLE